MTAHIGCDEEGPRLLQKYFEQVWVINLQRPTDRLSRFREAIEMSGWPFRHPKVFSAIDGDKVGVPAFWRTGAGSYGCLRSHLVLLERAIQDDIGSMLVMEDDAVFTKTFGADVAEFLAKVPTDWQCSMLGGQHINSKPFPVVPGVVRAGSGGGIQRAHCYALRGQEIMKELYLTWANSAVHCDWVMGPCTAKFNTYAPDPFLVGQADGRSDISLGQNPSNFWRTPSGAEPVIVLRAPREAMETLRSKGFHGGYTRDPATGIEVGLGEIFADTSLALAERNARLRNWLAKIQGESLSMKEPSLCTVWHPAVDAAMVRPLVKGNVVEIVASTVEEALSQVPTDIDIRKPISCGEDFPVVVLRSSRAVREILREEGWHGHCAALHLKRSGSETRLEFKIGRSV